MASNGKKLTRKQALFVRALASDPRANLTAAAKEAGYSEKMAGRIGWQLMNEPKYAHVQEAFNRLERKRLAKYDVTADRVIKRLSAIAFTDITAIAEWGKDVQGAPLKVKLEDGETDEIDVVRHGRLKLKDSAALWPEEAALISEVSEAHYDYGSTLKVKTHNQLEALKLLAKHLGLLKDRHVVEDYTSAEEELAELIKILQEGVADQDALLEEVNELLEQPPVDAEGQ